MPFAQKTLAKKIMTVALIVLVGVMLSSCLESVFNQPPNARLAVVEGIPYGPAPQTFVFDISGSWDPDGEIASFTLDFGDGSAPVEGTDPSETISHLYEEAGMYIVTLTVTDTYGKDDEGKLGFGLSSPTDT